MRTRVAVVGVGWSGFRPISPEFSYKELIYQAATQAYADAGVDPRRDVDSFITVAEDFNEGTSIFDEYTPDQLGAVLKPMHTITGDGLHGLATGYMLINTGQFSIVAVEAHSKASNMITLPEVIAYAQDPIINRPLRFNTHFVAGLEMNRYLYDSGTSLEACAAVVVKNRKNALHNPSAPYAADLTIEEVMAGAELSWPLNVRHTAQHADGAIVLVMAAESVALSLTDKPVWINGVGWCNGSASLEYREWGHSAYVEKAAKMAYRQAGIQNPLLAFDFAEVEDSYAFKELETLEAMGFFHPGGAGLATLDGVTIPGGELPINISGGSLGWGNLLDANGLARALEVVLQLRGQAGQRQLANAHQGLAQAWRGVPTSSSAVAVFAV